MKSISSAIESGMNRDRLAWGWRALASAGGGFIGLAVAAILAVLVVGDPSLYHEYLAIACSWVLVPVAAIGSAIPARSVLSSLGIGVLLSAVGSVVLAVAVLASFVGWWL